MTTFDKWTDEERAVAVESMTGWFYGRIEEATVSAQLALDLACQRNELRKALTTMLTLFDKDHAIDRFNWAESFLRAQDIKELNDTPIQARAALEKCK